MLDYALAANIGFSHFVSLGNKADVDAVSYTHLDVYKRQEREQSMHCAVQHRARARQGAAAQWTGPF